jgi:hypothetical protein
MTLADLMNATSPVRSGATHLISLADIQINPVNPALN